MEKKVLLATQKHRDDNDISVSLAISSLSIANQGRPSIPEDPSTCGLPHILHDGWHDGDATATAMDGTTAMHRQCDGDNDATATTGAGSLAAARRRRRWWWRRYRMTAVTAEA